MRGCGRAPQLGGKLWIHGGRREKERSGQAAALSRVQLQTELPSQTDRGEAEKREEEEYEKEEKKGEEKREEEKAQKIVILAQQKTLIIIIIIQ